MGQLGFNPIDWRLAMDPCRAHSPVMNEERRVTLLKTAQLLLVVVFSLTLGRITIQFRGDVWSWVGVVLHVGIIAWLLYMLIRDFWKPKV